MRDRVILPAIITVACLTLSRPKGWEYHYNIVQQYLTKKCYSSLSHMFLITLEFKGKYEEDTWKIPDKYLWSNEKILREWQESTLSLYRKSLESKRY